MGNCTRFGIKNTRLASKNMHYCVLIIFTVATSVIGQTLRPHQQVLIEPEITFEGFGGAPCCGDLGPGPPAPRLPPP